MSAVRDAWTDERLDELSKRVDDGFRVMTEEFRAVRGEISAMQRVMVQTTVGMCAAMVTGFCALAALIVSQG